MAAWRCFKGFLLLLGESAGSRSRSGTDAFQGQDSSMLNRKPSKSAAETVQRAADTGNARVKHSWKKRTQADSLKAMGVSIRVHYENTLRKDKP